ARSQTRLVVAEHSTLTQDIDAATAVMRQALPWLMKRTYRRADAVVVVSAGVAADLASALELDASCIHTIFNPVVTSELEVRSHEAIAHPWLDRSDAPLVLAAGRLTEAKNFAGLIEAFHHLR